MARHKKYTLFVAILVASLVAFGIVRSYWAWDDFTYEGPNTGFSLVSEYGTAELLVWHRTPQTNPDVWQAMRGLRFDSTGHFSLASAIRELRDSDFGTTKGFVERDAVLTHAWHWHDFGVFADAFNLRLYCPWWGLALLALLCVLFHHLAVCEAVRHAVNYLSEQCQEDAQ